MILSKGKETSFFGLEVIINTIGIISFIILLVYYTAVWGTGDSTYRTNVSNGLTLSNMY